MGTPLPVVSIVIPARDASGTIAATIGGALAQDYSGEIEVVVAAPPDDPLRALPALADPRVRIVDSPDGRTPTGLNAAIAAARGTVIVRCDAHSVLPPDYVRIAVEVLGGSAVDVVGGIQRPAGDRFFQRAVGIAQSTPIGVGDARYRRGGDPGPVDTVYLGVFRRETLDRVGGFAPDLDRNQDYELNHRIRATGGVVWFDPRLVVDYAPRSKTGRLWRQYFDYGRWKRIVVRRHPRSLRWRQLVAPLLVLGLVVSGVLAAVGATLPALVIPSLYGAGLAITGIVESLRRRTVAGLAAPFALVVMHLAWGIGFLVGQRTVER